MPVTSRINSSWQSAGPAGNGGLLWKSLSPFLHQRNANVSIFSSRLRVKISREGKNSRFCREFWYIGFRDDKFEEEKVQRVNNVASSRSSWKKYKLSDNNFIGRLFEITSSSLFCINLIIVKERNCICYASRTMFRKGYLKKGRETFPYSRNNKSRRAMTVKITRPCCYPAINKHATVFSWKSIKISRLSSGVDKSETNYYQKSIDKGFEKKYKKSNKHSSFLSTSRELSYYRWIVLEREIAPI